MSIDFLRAARDTGDEGALLRYARLHLGDGDESVGRAEIDRAYVRAIEALIESPATEYERIRSLVATTDTATLAHLFLYAHFELLRRSDRWIHDGEL